MSSDARVVAIVQARMGSTRLPGKVLLDLHGKSMLARVLERLGRSRRIDQIVVATTTLPADDRLAALCTQLGTAVVRGPEQDVLTRYRMAADAHPAAVYVRITSDCPLLSPRIVDDVVAGLGDADYCSNTLEPRTFPRGLDAEAMTDSALREADRADTNPAWREHVTPYLYRNPHRFRLLRHESPVDLSHHRWTVDTPEDYALVQRVFAHFKDLPFEMEDVLGLLARNPAWTALNESVAQKHVPP